MQWPDHLICLMCLISVRFTRVLLNKAIAVRIQIDYKRHIMHIMLTGIYARLNVKAALSILGMSLAILTLLACKKQSASMDNETEDTVIITCGMVAQEHEACKKGVELWEKKTGKRAKVVPAPNGSNERLTLFQQHLAAESPDIDIYQVDVVWPGLLSHHLEDLSPYLTKERYNRYIPQLIQNNTINGRLIALPWFGNVGLLYYRKDLLEKYNRPVPQTWEELEDTATYIMQKERAAGNADLWGYVFQGKAYEGLTCNAIEWISSYPHGGHVVEKDGSVSLNNLDARYILNKIGGWVGTISPPGVLNYEQEDCRGIFQLGKTVFMRNWPYAWAVLNSAESLMAGKVGITLLPKGTPGGHSSGAIGGWNLAVSKYSRHKKNAVDLVLFLTSESELKRRAVESGFYPTMHALYKDPDVLAVSPIMPIMLPVFQNATPRPSAQTGSKYSQVSAIFWNAVYSVLSHKKSAETVLPQAEKKLNFISKNGTKWYKQP